MQELESSQLAPHPLVVQSGLRRVHWRQAVRALVHRGREVRLLDAIDNLGISFDCTDYLVVASSERPSLNYLYTSI